jgi:zinc transporter
VATHDIPAVPTHYGADANGLICGFVLRPDHSAEAIDSDAAAPLLRALAAAREGRFLWLHFNLAHAAAEAWLRAHSGLDESFYEALHEGSRATRIERVLDTLFAVVNDVTFDFAFEASDVATLWISARAHVVITARRSPLRSVDRLRAAVKRGERLATHRARAADQPGVGPVRHERRRRAVQPGADRVLDGPRVHRSGHCVDRLARGAPPRTARLTAP